MSDPELPPSEVIRKNRKLQKRFQALSKEIPLIDAPRKVLELQRGKLAARIFEFERDRAINAYNSDKIAEYRLTEEHNSEELKRNDRLAKIRDLHNRKLPDRYRKGVQPGRILKSCIGAAFMIPVDVKPVKIGNQKQFEEVLSKNERE